MKVRIDALEKFIEERESRANARLALWPDDPLARGMGVVVGELRELISKLREESRQFTVEQYAEDRGVTPQTVRRWIRNGQLRAEETPHGYVIPADAEPVDEVRRAS